ncbi:YidH family protein [Rhodococcus sp. NPDC055024]
MNDNRWPRWVFATGSEPDYRFSFANERTFLAWIRTSVALIAGGIAVHAVDLALSDLAKRGLSAALVGLGIVCAGASWARWARAERAMRKGDPLPSSRLGVLLVATIVVLAATMALAL